MSSTSLTIGSVRALVSNDTSVNNPVMQVINVKQVASGNNERFRVVISDGTNYVQGMLATQLNHLVHSKQICENTIVLVRDHITNLVQGKTIVILLGVDILNTNGHKIGNPVEYTSNANAVTQPPQSATNMYGNTSKPDSSYSNPYGGAPPKQQQYSPQKTYSNKNSYNVAPIVRSNDTNSSSHFTPIKDLNMYQNRWTIKARVTIKSAVKEWSNARGQGKLFSISILDASDMDIRATFFKEAVDRFYSMLEVGSVYTFSNGRLKVANAQYNTCKSSFEISFDDKAEIAQVSNDTHIKEQQFDFKKIGQLEATEPGAHVDLLAVVKSVGIPSTVMSKKSGQELQKCDMTLVDDSGAEISLTLWGERGVNADKEFAGQPIVAFKNLRLGDFSGRSLSSSFDGVILKEPTTVSDVPQLRSWWDSVGRMGAAKSLSTGMGGSGGGRDSFENRKCISDIKDEQLGHGEKPDWISVKSTFNFFKKDKDGGPWYTACPNEGEPCKNRFKVTQTTDGQYHCDRCSKTYPNCMRRFIFSATITDDTCTTWVSIFDEQARLLLGGDITADELNNKCFQENYDQDTFDSYFAKVQFTDWVIKLKVKQEMVGDEQRVKSTVYSLTPMDYASESRELLKAIEAM